MCSRKLSALLALVLAFAAPSARASQDAGWPRAVIVVFERRVPERMAAPDNAGVRLRELREKVTEQIRALQLRKGDHIFLFADGISKDDFNCLVHGQFCDAASPGSQALQWREGPLAAKSFLAHMLQLPRRPHLSASNRVIGAGGEQFVHLIYEGDPETVDCAMRREITAPLTKNYDITAQCPAEGVEIDREQTKAISRVEMSLPIQVGAAISAASKGGPVCEVTWIWALLGEKDYKREDTINGIRLDFDHSDALVDFFEHADQAYQVHLERPPIRLPGGPSVVLYRIGAASTQSILDQIDKSPDVLDVTVGSQKRAAVQKDLTISTSFLGGPWKPEVDSLRFCVRLSPSIPGRILGGQIGFADHGSSPPVSPVDGVVSLQSETAEEDYQKSLRSKLWQKGASFRAQVDVLLAGPDSPQPYGFAAIPAPHSIFRNIQVERHAANARDVSLIVTLLAAILIITLSVFLPHSFELSPQPAKLEWTFPSAEQQRELTLRLVGYSQAVGRGIFDGPTNISIQWQFFPPQQLPVKRGRAPVHVLDDDIPIPSGVWRHEVIRWHPGRADKPRTLKSLRVRLDSNAFDSTAISRPENLGCIFQLQVMVEPKLFLRLRPAAKDFYIPATIQISEEAPHPRFSFNIASSYRRLGFAEAAEGGNFGYVAVENMPELGGVAREVVAKLSIEMSDSPDCRVSFDAPGEPTTISFPVTSGDRQAFGLILTPTVHLSDPLPRIVRGSIKGDLVDKTTGDQCGAISHPWNLTWLPKGARLAGMDIGTSGVRLFLDNPARRHTDIQAKFSMSNVNPFDTDQLLEFPSLVRIDGVRGVVRAGSRQFGVYAQGGGRLVESAKAALLGALGQDGEEQARADFEQYVCALGKTWMSIREEQGIEHARFVVTIPWSYGQAIAKWYCDLISKYFAGAILVTVVREAESAAYFRLLRERFASPSAKERFPRDREHRTLVVDVGAGTVDFAVVAVRAPEGIVEELAMLAHTFSYWAGNRYDEELLTNVFDCEDARALMSQGRELRNTIRLFKQNRLHAMLTGEGPPAPVLIDGRQVLPVVTSRDEFLEKMRGWFHNAITDPLTKVAQQLGASRLQIDELLLAGRGVLAFGCRDQIESDVRRLFRPAPNASTVPTVSFAAEDLPWVIAKGALSFSRSGLVLVGDSDFVVTRDVTLVVDLENELITKQLFKAGTSQRDGGIRKDFGIFSRDIRHAWIIAGEPFLSDESIRNAVARMRTNDSPENGVRVLDYWQERSGFRRLVLQIDNEESVYFVKNAPRVATEGALA